MDDPLAAVRPLRYCMNRIRGANNGAWVLVLQLTLGSPNTMDWRRWTWKSTTVAILLALFLVLNPELRALLLVINGLGLELVIFLIGLQLRSLRPTVGILAMQVGTFLCGAVYKAFRGATRALALLAPPGRATFGLSAFLFVLSHNLWCPLLKSGP
jgi:hypothetical protein